MKHSPLNKLNKSVHLFVIAILFVGCKYTGKQANVNSDAVTENIVMMVNLKNDSNTIRRYEAYHAAAWPEVTEASRVAGFKKIDIYRLGNRLVMVLNVPKGWDAENSTQRYLNYSPKVKEWVDTMAAMQEVSPEAPEGSTGWSPMKRIYSFDAGLLKDLHR